jgi:hypothetical protein
MSLWPVSYKKERQMPMDTEAIEQEVERTLSLLETLEKTPAPPFFYTRLTARMRSQETEHRATIFIGKLRMSLAAGAAALLLVVNIYTIVHSTEESQTASKQTTLSSIADVYALTDDNY